MKILCGINFIEDQRLQILQFGLTVKMYDLDSSDRRKVFKIFVLDLLAYSTYGLNMHFLGGEQIFHL